MVPGFQSLIATTGVRAGSRPAAGDRLHKAAMFEEAGKMFDMRKRVLLLSSRLFPAPKLTRIDWLYCSANVGLIASGVQGTRLQYTYYPPSC